MNKKEVLEIRKQFSPANCAITRICGCYVDHEKSKRLQSREAFCRCRRKRRSNILIFLRRRYRTIGKNMLNMEFPFEQEMPGGTQEFSSETEKQQAAGRYAVGRVLR